MSLPAWKKIVKKLTFEHQQEGSSIVLFDPHSKGYLVNLTEEDLYLEIDGKELQSKKVRKFLWENRKKRAFQRKRGLVWSAYIEDEDKSYVGVGALTTKKVAERMNGV